MSSSSHQNKKLKRTTHDRQPTKRPLEIVPFKDPAVTITERACELHELASCSAPLLKDELEDILHSIENVLPVSANVDLQELRTFLESAAHLTHKKWDITAHNAERLGKILLPDNKIMDRQLLERILNEGNWDKAVAKKPWAVLVTGVNGIRKTTSLHQPWFDELLQEALISPEKSNDERPTVLPTGENAFFRQLDHMIATLVNQEFAKLYQLSKQLLGSDEEKISDKLVSDYSHYKAGIFARYRTLSELLGIVLLKVAQSESRSCMLETSGRDVAMFHYVDRFFPEHYHKLALHFEINDLECAKQSVDQRMKDEINIGIHALDNLNVFDVIYANKGGPYGSSVLQGIQDDSDRVWKSEILSGKVGKDWYKATIHITAHPERPWTAQAVKPDGTLGKVFEFEQR